MRMTMKNNYNAKNSELFWKNYAEKPHEAATDNSSE